MDNLVTGMNAGIGPPGTDQINRMIRYLCHSPGQFRFNRTNAGFLKLPTMKAAAIVFKRERYAPCSDGVIRGQGLGFEKQV
jgi:hypothetical protein